MNDNFSGEEEGGGGEAAVEEQIVGRDQGGSGPPGRNSGNLSKVQSTCLPPELKPSRWNFLTALLHFKGIDQSGIAAIILVAWQRSIFLLLQAGFSG